MKVVASLLLCVVFPGWVSAQKSCGAMTKELHRLRVEYHQTVNSPDAKMRRVGFDELAEILDKIVDLKNEMRKTNCKIPPRPKTFE